MTRTIDCRGCNQRFPLKRIDCSTYCSRECAFGHRKRLSAEKAVARREARAIELAGRAKLCVRCGQKFQSVQPRARHCSSRCSVQTHVIAQEARRTGRERPSEITCKWCGRICSIDYGDKRRGYCSQRCSRAPHKTRRRALEKILKAGGTEADYEPVTPVSVFEAAGWTCWLCGNQTVREKAVPHPLSPTIDHVVAVAVGGTHERGNLRCAHFICNCRRGDRDTVFDWSASICI